MAYASITQFKDLVAGGEDANRLGDMFPSTVEATQDDLIEQALNAASANMDATFYHHHSTPIDVSALAETAALLAQCCISLAAASLRVGAGVPDDVKTDAGYWNDWLKEIRGEPAFSDQGTLTYVNPSKVLPGVPRRSL